MPITPPTAGDLARIAQQYGLHLQPQDLDSFRALAGGLLASYDEVERLYAASLPEPPQRPWQWPAEDGNALGAWYVTTEITAAGDGPLAGRRVAVKDNIEVAGVPMMNGSAAVEGFVPRRDATVVTRLLDAGATIAGKAVCEDLCFSGGSHTSRTGPVRNPWDRSRSAGGSSSGSAALVAAGAGRPGARRRPGRLDPDPQRLLRHGRAQADARPGPLHRRVPDREHPRPPGPDHPDRAGRRADARRPGRAGRARPAPARATPPPQDYLPAWTRARPGCGSACWPRGSASPACPSPPSTRRSGPPSPRWPAAGAEVSEVSVPWHRDAMHVWTVIATDGVVTQMIDGNGFGMNWPGRYDPELIAHYARGRREHADELPETVKATIFAGPLRDRQLPRPVLRDGPRTWRSSWPPPTTRRWPALDVLVLPTLPIVATASPRPAVPREESIARSTEMIVNTAPFDVTGHPATSVPAGLADGLPAGLMIVGRHFDDATCLRAAHALETAVGGFPTP